jgi:hypothetical protein
MAMVYAREAGYPPELCHPGAERMVKNYISAWIMHQMANGDLDVASKAFIFQDSFVDIWREYEYDLITFTRGQLEFINGLIGDLVSSRFPTQQLEAISDKMEFFFEVRYNLDISSADWELYGPKLVIGWCLHAEAEDKAKAERVAVERLKRETFDTQEAKATAERAAAYAGDNVLRQVHWDSPLLNTLLKPVDDVK